MNLSNFRVEKLIQEDSFQRFSTGYLNNESAEINLISIKNPASILTTTRLLIADHLYNVLKVFEDQNELHIVLKQPEGTSLEAYLEQPVESYDQRIYLGLSLLKALNKYDTFSNAIKYQLLDDNQLLIHDDVICFRELIDYTTITHHSFKDVIFKIARLLERIIKPQTEIHQQFVDNLLIGNHHYYTLSDLLQDYKNIFIYEKPECLAKITQDYHIILTQNDQGSSLSKQSETIVKSTGQSSSSQTAPEDVSSDLCENITEEYATMPKSLDVDVIDLNSDPKAFLDTDLQSEAASDISNLSEINFDENDTLTPFDVLSSKEDPFAESELLRSELSKLLFTEDVTITTDTRRMPTVDDMDATFAEVRRAHKSNIIPDATRSTPKYPDWDDEHLVTESDTLLEDIFTEDDLEPFKWQKIVFPLLTTVALVLIIFFATKFFWGNSTDLKASYKITFLEDNRVAFVNTSPDLKNIDVCEWTVYYDDQLIETYESENFYPVFDTEGKYAIVLRIMDKNGNWSKAFKKDYVYTSNSSDAVNN